LVASGSGWRVGIATVVLMRCWGRGIDQATAKAAADAALADAASIPLTPALFFAGCVAASALLAGRQLKAWRSQKTQSECAPLQTSQPTRRFRLLRAGLRGDAPKRLRGRSLRSQVERMGPRGPLRLSPYPSKDEYRMRRVCGTDAFAARLCSRSPMERQPLAPDMKDGTGATQVSSAIV
jgi:hypothetical protein